MVYRTNKYTAGYQNLVDSYGVNSYREVGLEKKVGCIRSGLLIHPKDKNNMAQTVCVPKEQHCLKHLTPPSVFVQILR